MSAAVEEMQEVLEVIAESKRRSLFEPQWFLYNILNQTDSDPWQTDGIEAIADVFRRDRGMATVINHEGLSRITIRSPHGPGKTHWLAQVIHWWNYCMYGLVVATAPKEKQLKTRLWPRYRKILRGAIPSYREMIEVNALHIKILKDEDWGCVGETASDPDNMSGYHDEPQLFVVDEASARVLDPMFPVIEGTLTTPGSILAMIGNPTRVEGEFYDSHTKKNTKKLYFQFHIKPEDSKRIDKKWLDSMMAKYGKDSPVVKVRCLGEFAPFDEYILIPMEYIEDSFDIEEVTDGSIPRLRVSVDVADGGQDDTVITVGRHYDSFIQILKQQAFNFPTALSPIMAADAAQAAFEAYDGSSSNGDDIVIDSMGVGAGTAGTLIERGLPVVIYKGGAASSDNKRWRNRRVQSYISLYEHFSKSRIRISEGAIDDEEEFRAHLLSIKRRLSNERLDDIEPKDMIKKALLPSPDRGDSLAMQMTDQIPEFLADGNGVPVLLGLNSSMVGGYDGQLT